MNVLGWEIVIACDDRQKKILSDAVPQAHFTHLKGYGISYGNSGIYTITRWQASSYSHAGKTYYQSHEL